MVVRMRATSLVERVCICEGCKDLSHDFPLSVEWVFRCGGSPEVERFLCERELELLNPFPTLQGQAEKGARTGIVLLTHDALRRTVASAPACGAVGRCNLLTVGRSKSTQLILGRLGRSKSTQSHSWAAWAARLGRSHFDTAVDPHGVHTKFGTQPTKFGSRPDRPTDSTDRPGRPPEVE